MLDFLDYYDENSGDGGDGEYCEAIDDKTSDDVDDDQLCWSIYSFCYFEILVNLVEMVI